MPQCYQKDCLFLIALHVLIKKKVLHVYNTTWQAVMPVPDIPDTAFYPSRLLQFQFEKYRQTLTSNGNMDQYYSAFLLYLSTQRAFLL